jgi:hypothetical protein
MPDQPPHRRRRHPHRHPHRHEQQQVAPDGQLADPGAPSADPGSGDVASGAVMLAADQARLAMERVAYDMGQAKAWLRMRGDAARARAFDMVDAAWQQFRRQPIPIDQPGLLRHLDHIDHYSRIASQVQREIDAHRAQRAVALPAAQAAGAVEAPVGMPYEEWWWQYGRQTGAPYQPPPTGSRTPIGVSFTPTGGPFQVGNEGWEQRWRWPFRTGAMFNRGWGEHWDMSAPGVEVIDGEVVGMMGCPESEVTGQALPQLPPGPPPPMLPPPSLPAPPPPPLPPLPQLPGNPLEWLPWVGQNWAPVLVEVSAWNGSRWEPILSGGGDVLRQLNDAIDKFRFVRAFNPLATKWCTVTLPPGAGYMELGTLYRFEC